MDLYICVTPLQLLIAENIKKIKGWNAHLLYLPLKDNEVNRKYYNRLKNSMSLSLYVKNSSLFLRLLRVFYFSIGKKYKTIYLASIDSVLIHYVLSYVNFENVETFDDGTLNISYDGRYYNERPKNNRLLNRVAHKVLHRKYDMERIKSQAIKHYTIYKNMDNIIKNVEFIEVFHRNENIISTSKNEISIFLGTIYREFTGDNERNVIDGILNLLSSADNFYYLPHPREETNDFQKYYMDESFCLNELSEFVIIRLLAIYSKVNLYGFASSTQFNLANMPGVSCYVIKSKYIDDITENNSNKLIKMGASYVVI